MCERMVKPWEISREELQTWASRVEAPAVLPRLVRRLLLATSPLRGIAMRADGGTRYKGWDGIVQASAETAFCPRGLSVWELSVEKKVRTKLEQDYQKRSRKPPEGVLPSLATYVAVTAHAFPGKSRWVAEKRAEGVWADVRVYDVDDLAQWLEQAPAVARWFANLQGHPAYEGRDVEAFLEAWSKRTTPALPPALVLAGEKRQRQSDALLQALDAPAGKPVPVRGRTREEALLFAAATVARQPGAEARLSRALVVETEDAWRWALRVQSAEPMIVLPTFEGPDLGQAAASGVRVLLPGDRSMPVQLDVTTLTLEEQAYPPLAQVLVSEGWSASDAERLVRRAGGNLEVLQHLCGYVEFTPPPWAKDSPRAELLALLLIGAWVPTVEADREIVRRLGGDPAVAEQLCIQLQARDVMKRITEYGEHDVLRWAAPERVWHLLAAALTEGHLERFRDVAMDVLGAEDPAYELPKEERYLAAIKKKVLPHSRAARLGLAESIARFSLHDDRLAETLGKNRGAALAEGLVGWLLRPERKWSGWASLSDVLTFLAEAAPKRFLDRAESSIDQGEAGLAHLFLDEGPLLFGPAPHTGVLWALEVLAWHPEESVRLRVILALTRLDARYPRGDEGRIDNRPIRSLDALLRYVLPRSSTTVAERIALIRQVFQSSPPTGRELCLGMLKNLRGATLMNQGYKPKVYVQWAPEEEPTNIDEHDVSVQVRALLEDLGKDAGADPQRWNDLLRAVLNGPEDVERVVLDALAKHRGEIRDRDTAAQLWGTLRETLAYAGSESDSPRARAVRLKALYEEFTPSDFSRRHAWRFEQFPRIPGWNQLHEQEMDERLTALRAETAQELWQHEDPWNALAALTREVLAIEGGSFLLGFTLGRSPFAGELEPRILADSADELLVALAHGFASARTRELGLTWLEGLLRRWVRVDRTAEAAGVAVNSGEGRSMWDLLERIGEPLLAEYWKIKPRVLGIASVDDAQYAVERLLSVGREQTAIETVALHRRQATGALAFQVLERYAARLKATAAEAEAQGRIAGAMLPRYVEWLFGIIDRDPPQGKDPISDISPLEMFFLPILAGSSRPARYVSLAFGEDPANFVQLVTMLYRREGEEPPAEPDEGRIKKAERALAVLHAWKGYPGEGLPEPERDERLERWASAVLEEVRAAGRGRVGSIHVAEVLTRVPPSDDGLWPCVAARRLLEMGLYPNLADDLALAKRNLRGLTGRDMDEGGAQELELAKSYHDAAQQLELTYPRTAAMLDGLARHYEAEAEQEEAIARRVRIEHGEQANEEEEEEPLPPSPRRTTGTDLRDFVSRIITTGVGPASHFEVPLDPRLNLWLGDNSTGKTFLLDVLWWALTGSWADLPAKPPTRRRPGRPPAAATIAAEAGGRKLQAEYNHARGTWKKRGPRSLAPGLVVYARVDGSFAVWDPIRNARPAEKGQQDLSKGYHFTPHSLWYGLDAPDGITRLCRGLIEDAVSWKDQRRRAFALLEKVLSKLAPPGETLKFGMPQRFKVSEARPYPTLDLGYDASVFAVHASAAVKRILSLAYALVWAVSELQEVAPLAGVAPLRRVTLLWDEVESHLHPRWQRAVLPALLSIMEDLAPQAEVQLVVTTHAPLVLASMEPLFDEKQDALLEFSLESESRGKVVRVTPERWERLGDVNTWLMQHFGLKQPRSIDAERVIERAARAIENPELSKKEGREIHRELRDVLGELDPFWVRWRFIAEKRGWVR